MSVDGKLTQWDWENISVQISLFMRIIGYWEAIADCILIWNCQRIWEAPDLKAPLPWSCVSLLSQLENCHLEVILGAWGPRQVPKLRGWGTHPQAWEAVLTVLSTEVIKVTPGRKRLNLERWGSTRKQPSSSWWWKVGLTLRQSTRTEEAWTSLASACSSPSLPPSAAQIHHLARKPQSGTLEVLELWGHCIST